MIMSLIKVRLQSLFSSMFIQSSNKKMGKGKKILFLLLGIYVISALLMMFAMFFSEICVPLVTAGLGQMYFLYAFIISAALCFIGSAFATQSQLFEAKDNDLLFSMPLKPMDILLSRISSLYILNLIYEVVIVIPCIAVYFTKFDFSFILLLNFLIIALLLPFFSLAISCVVGYVLAIAMSRMRNKTLISTILSVAFLLGYMYFYSRLNVYIQAVITKSMSYSHTLGEKMPIVLSFGKAVADKDFLSLILSALFCIIPFVIVCFFLGKHYIKIITTKRGFKPRVFDENEIKLSSPKKTLIKKELMHFFSSAMYVLNAGIGCIFLIIFAVVIAIKSNDLASVFAQFGENLDMNYICIAAISMICTTIFISAPSISLEGRNLWLIKSIPIKTKDTLLSKAYAHFIVAAVPTFFASVMCIIFVSKFSLSSLFLLVTPQFINLFCALFGVAVNLQFPKFDWISEVVAIKQGVSSIVSMFGSFGVIILLFLPYLAFNMKMSLNIYLLLQLDVLIVMCYLFYRYLINGGVKKFEAI